MKWIPAVLITFACCAGQDNPELFPIAGTVVETTSAKPLSRVRVVLADAARPAVELASSVTTEDGRFRFEVPKGKFSLRAERNGLPGQPYGAESLYSGFGVSIVAGPGQQTGNLTFPVFPPAVISGTVMDEVGEPVENAIVQLLRSHVVAGRRAVATLAWAYTNDLGEYRFSRLPAGAYYLAVTGRPWYASSRQSGSGSGQTAVELSHIAFAPSFHANTGDPRAASPILVNPGQEAVANFSLYSKRGFNIAVNCAACRGSRMRLDLTCEGILGVRSSQRVTYFYGSAVLPAVPPGRYWIRINNEDALKPLVAMAQVEVASGDVEVALTPKEAAKVTGTVTLQDGDPKMLSRLFVSLRSEEDINLGFTRELAPDGTFEVPIPLPGKYRLWTTGVRGVFASRAASEDPAFQNGVIDIGAGTVRVNVVASSGVGRVKGFVRRNGEPVPGILVVMASAGLPTDPGWYSGFKTDSDGSFDFNQLRPGDYRLFALTDTQFEYANPAAIRPYLAGAKPILVEAHGLVEQNLDLP